ncbi:ATP-binding protein [uncultured Pseudoteredinibacter sp.]|uniref:hybrid sensor histidine kinase/response regulator n=1 Tax=uncultured Pseudoteredinibacter sp. TaxID=1641701 RepID=UPI0026077FDC|nr:ATP-binding protein [uncultured Pseudoteredinibacter sp.]
MKIFSKIQYSTDELETIELEHRSAYLKLFVSTVFVQALFPLLLSYVFCFLVDTTVLLSWLISILAVTLARSYLSFGWYKRNSGPRNTVVFEWLSLLLSFMAGCLWGVTVLALDFQQYPEESVFLNIIVFGLAAGSVGIGSYWLEYFMVYNFTVFAIYIVSYSVGFSEPYYLLAASTMLFVVFMTQIALVFHRGNAQNILLSKRNEKLAKNLARQKVEAESIASSRNRFLAAASHDLRQPVQALNFFLEVLRWELNTENGLETYSKIQKCTDGINDLLNSILDLSRLDADIVSVNQEVCSIGAILEDLDQQFRGMAERKGLQFEVKIANCYVHCDQTFLKRILSNLIANAIAYTDKGIVEVSAVTSVDKVSLEVSDSGPGLTKDEQGKVFEEFYQLGNPERDRKKGLGLGLSIVKRLCALLNVPLSLSSQKGKGSCFSVQLKLCEAGPQKKTQAKVSVQTLTQSKNVIIIDDEADIRQSLHDLLVRWQCCVQMAASLEEATDILRERQFEPDLIIADYRLRNNKTGVEAIEALKELCQNEYLPAIIISGDTEPGRIKEVIDSGYTLLHKPVKPAYLRRVLQQTL